MAEVNIQVMDGGPYLIRGGSEVVTPVRRTGQRPLRSRTQSNRGAASTGDGELSRALLWSRLAP